MTERHDPYVSLRNRNFRWYVASLVAFTMGTQIQATVVAWQVYAITGDPLSLGLVGLAEALPFQSKHSELDVARRYRQLARSHCPFIRSIRLIR